MTKIALELSHAVEILHWLPPTYDSLSDGYMNLYLRSVSFLCFSAAPFISFKLMFLDTRLLRRSIWVASSSGKRH